MAISKIPGAGISGGSVTVNQSAPDNSLVIDSSGNVGVGTSSPTPYNSGAKLIQVNSGTVNSELKVTNSTTGTASNAGLAIVQSGTTSYVWNGSNGFMGFGTNDTERMRIDTEGYLQAHAGTGALTGTTYHSFRTSTSSNTWVMWQRHETSTAGNAYGTRIEYRNAAPNGTGNEFLWCIDMNQVRAAIRSNGGLANYSANNVNLSDERTKTDIELAGSYLDKICAIPVKTFKYKDQTDDALNLGVIAQDVEAVAPELVDVSGFGKTPEDGVPLKAVYQTDIQYALMKCIQEQQAIINDLKARIETLESK